MLLRRLEYQILRSIKYKFSQLRFQYTGDVKKLGQHFNLRMGSPNKKFKKTPFTHFISVPLNEASIIQKYYEFKDDILHNIGKDTRGVNEKVFQKPQKLHLTIGVMTLLENAEKQQAIETLYKCKEDYIKPLIDKNGPINVKVQGVNIMNENPEHVRVLYGMIIDESGVFQEISDNIMNRFADIGYMRKEQGVKLHMTIMNTKFVRKKKAEGRTSRSFDASKILELHKDTHFGNVTISTIHISNPYEVDVDGYYEAMEKMNLH